MKKISDILTRVWIVLATVVVIVGALLAIAALHVFKFVWFFLGQRKKGSG